MVILSPTLCLNLKKTGLAIFIVLCVYAKDSEGTGMSSQEQKVCKTEECKIIASRLFNNINQTVDPCDDFYQFACGNYIKTSKVSFDYIYVTPFDNSSNEIYDKLEKSLEEEILNDDPVTFKILKQYYKNCLNEGQEKVTEFVNILKDLGGWPLLEKYSWNESSFDWINTTYEIQNLDYTSQDFITITATKNDTYSDKITVEIDLPIDYWIKKEENLPELLTNKTEAYLKYITGVAKIFKSNSTDLTREINQMLDFETELSKIVFQNTMDQNQTMTVSELQKKFPDIQWLDYFNRMLYPQLKLKDTDEIIVHNQTYFKNFFQLMAKTPKREQANYIFWCFIRVHSELLSTRLRKIAADFLIEIKGKNFVHYRKSNECAIRVVEAFPMAANLFYGKKHFDFKKKELVSSIFEDVRTSFGKILNNADWLDTETKNSTLKKLTKIIPVIGFPDEFLNNDVLDSYHSFLDVKTKNSLKTKLNILGCELMFKKFLNDNIYSFINDFSPDDAGVKYVSGTNLIAVPLGIIEALITDVDVPKYVSYGSLGSTIGHGFGRAYDSVNELFSEFKKSNSSWNSTTQQEFLDRSKCVLDQYGNYTLKEADKKLNFDPAKIGDVADNIGLKVSYNAYKSWKIKNGEDDLLPGFEKYTPEQIFWISFAQNYCEKVLTKYNEFYIRANDHSPSELRVIGSLFNMPEFAEDFKCPAESKMNPIHKCIMY